MKNPLMADLYMNNIKLVCRYEEDNEEMDEAFIEQQHKTLTLKSLETKEILMEIKPLKKGTLIIERLEWILFDVVSCTYQLVTPTEKDKKILTKEE
jgi:hypothetical protein